MKRKISTCIECKNEKWIYARKMCQYCYWKSRSKPTVKKPQKPIKRYSKKELKRLRIYRKKREEYFKRNPVCEYPNCNSRKITLHHKKGRIGDLLIDDRFFCSLCWPHHQEIEQNPALAIELGLSLKRL